MSFKLKTLLIFLAISLIPYAMTMLLFGNSYREEQTQQVLLDLNRQLNKTVENIDKRFDSMRQDLSFLARSDVMNDIYTKDLDQRISTLLRNKKEDMGLIGDLYVTNERHSVIASSDLNTLGSIHTSKGAFLSTPIFSSFNKELLIGHLHLDYDLKNLKTFFETSDYRQYYLLLDNKQEAFRSMHFDEVLQIDKRLKGDKNITIVLEEDKAHAYALLKKYEKWFILILIVGLFIITLIALFFAQRLIRPILTLSSTAQRITSTQDYSQRVPFTSEDEIGQLAHSFDQMIEGMDLALRQNELLNMEIEDTQREVVFTMGAIGESRSKETGNHVKRVAEYSRLLALSYGLSQEEAEMLKQASPMHDIGKVAIPDAILNKPGYFTQEEFEHMKKHASLGYEMLKHSNRTLLKTASIVAYEHHEKWDGTGYPNGTKGEQIHIYGRITALADVFDALGSDRVYKKAWSDEEIFELFKEERGRHFDPKLIDIFFQKLEAFLHIRDTFKDSQ